MITENNASATSEPLVEPTAPATAPANAEFRPQADSAGPVLNADTPKKMNAPVPESLGLRVRAAREAKGLTCEAAAQTLKLPVSIIHAIETERFERIGHAIYLRSYLTKYLQLLDLPQVLAERVLSEHSVAPPQLVTTGTVSRPRYLFDRYAGSALYLILTGVIVVPAVLLAMRAGFDQNLVRVTPLETPELTAPQAAPHDDGVSAAAPGKAADVAESNPAAPATEIPPAPLIASMTPFPSSQPAATTAAKPDAKTAVDSPAPGGAHTLRLSLAEASWVEIVASDGQKLEYGLLAAGSTRTYDSSKDLDVRIGNATGATLEVDGQAQDLAPYRHSNVAHLKVANGEITAPHSAG